LRAHFFIVDVKRAGIASVNPCPYQKKSFISNIPAPMTKKPSRKKTAKKSTRKKASKKKTTKRKVIKKKQMSCEFC